MKPFTVVSTFAGCGGSSLGYAMAGGKVLLAVEWDAHAVETYRANAPDTKVWKGDIRKLDARDAMRLAGVKEGKLDVLDGSPPCQGFSSAGHRRVGDLRNQLYREYVRLLRAFKPRAFVMENVRGLLSSTMRPILKDIVAQMRSSGYEIDVRLLNAKDYGVAQTRRRLIFVGARKDLKILPALEPETRPTPTAMAALKGCPKEKPVLLNGMVLWLWTKCRPGQKLKDVHPNGAFFSWAKLDPYGVCPTIVTDSYILHWREARYLTSREAARLQGFPDWFKWHGTLHERIKRIGNSVPPPLTRAVAELVKKQILSKRRES